MEEVYAYKEPGRRPITYLAAVVFAFVLGAGLYDNAPLLFLTPVLAGGAMLLYLLIKNPISGLVLLPDRLILSAWRKPVPVPLNEIVKIEIISWSDTTDMKVHLRSGGVINAFSGDIPPRASFAQALARVGIPLEMR